MAAFATSFLRRELLKPLVMACKFMDLTSEVDAAPFVPLLCDLFACDNTLEAFQMEGGKIAKDHELVYLGECHLSCFCHLQVFLDLFPQLLPSSDLTVVPFYRHWPIFFCIKKESHCPLLHV